MASVAPVLPRRDRSRSPPIRLRSRIPVTRSRAPCSATEVQRRVAVVLLGADAVIVRAVSPSERAVRLFGGEDVPLIEDGLLLDRSPCMADLRRADVEAALRAQGADGTPDVAQATLSPGGSVVVWLKSKGMSATRGDIDAVHVRLDGIQQAIDRMATERSRRLRQPPVSGRGRNGNGSSGVSCGAAAGRRRRPGCRTPPAVRCAPPTRGS